MKRYIVIFILSILLIPFFVNAETCESEKVTIKSVEISNSEGNPVEKQKPLINGKEISLNLIVDDVNDFIEYKMIIKNDSKEDYELDKTSLNANSDYIEYTFDTINHSNIVKAGEEKEVFLRVLYKNEVADNSFVNGVYNDNKSLRVNLATEDTSNNPSSLNNPDTGFELYLFIITVIIVCVFSLFFLRKNKKSKITALLIGFFILIPIGVSAICKCDIKVDSNVEIVKKNMFCVYTRNSIEENIKYYPYNDNDTFETYLNRENNMYNVLGLTEGYEFSSGNCETNTIAFGTLENLRNANIEEIYFDEVTTTIYPNNQIQNISNGCYVMITNGPCL